MKNRSRQEFPLYLAGRNSTLTTEEGSHKQILKNNSNSLTFLKKTWVYALVMLTGSSVGATPKSFPDHTNLQNISERIYPDPVTDINENQSTIIFFRHGEKPAEGLGQLSCKGLNRALALPKVLEKKFGRPIALFAPNPGWVINDHGTLYNYIRPLATMEPTAIRLGLPVNTNFGYQQIEQLKTELINPAYQGATVFVAWEHNQLNKLVSEMMDEYGKSKAKVPDWKSNDFDSIYIVKIKFKNGQIDIIDFARDSENLDNLADSCQ